jgi:putative DNA primase/helicase
MGLLDDALARVTRPRRDGDWFQALCPVHESEDNGHHPSLRLRSSTKVPDGVIVCCMAGCSRESLQQALGLMSAKVKTSPSDENTHLFYDPPEDDIVATYDYTDESGGLLFQKLRFEPKRFVQRSADGTYKLDGVRRVLYHLPELLPAETVYLCEGEKAADAVRTLGVVATCASGGAGKWRSEYADSLAGKRVVVLPDNDEQGRKHGEIVVRALRATAIECCIVKLPGLPEKGDPYDAVKAGLTADDLASLAAESFARCDERAVAKELKAVASEYRLSEGGNAERFVAEHGDILASVYEWEAMLVYSQGIFRRSEELLDRMAKKTVLGMYAEAATAPDGVRRGLAEHARRSDSKNARRNMVALARSEDSIEVKASEFDAAPELLCVKNGVVDLATGELHPHSPKYRMTRMAGASYDPEYLCPKWLGHLDLIFDGDKQLVDFFQRLMGYAITGYTREQLFAVFYGSGANGKSVTLHRIEEAMGDYSKTAAAVSLSQGKGSGGGTREDLVRLRAARLVTTFESENRKKLDAELVKQLTGGDRIAARGLYKGTTEFRPEFLVVMSTNHKPTVEVADFAIKRRVLLLPFVVTIPEEDRDPMIEHKLRSELDGILSWCVVGAFTYLSAGLQIPERVRAATDSYREEMDPMAGFREYVTFDGTAWTATSQIRQAVATYCKEEGIREPAGKELAAWLEKLGAIAERSNKQRGWRGIVVDGCTHERRFGETLG